MKKQNREEKYLINIEENKKLALQYIAQVITIFDTLGMPYWIEYGTLLGAVREGGFIPWDSNSMWEYGMKTTKPML